jgi:tetratricopeptide repeat protein 7
MEGTKKSGRFGRFVRWMSMQCLCSGDQMNGMDQVVQSSEAIIIKDGPTGRNSSPNFVVERHINNASIGEVQLSLQGGGSLNDEVCTSICGINLHMTKHIVNKCDI